MLLLFTCLTSMQLQAQKQRYHAALPTITETGFYEITVTPTLSACLNADLSDLRIADSAKHMIPYVIRNSKNVIASPDDTELPVTDNKTLDSGRSQFIIRNNTGRTIKTLLITTGNTAVMRKASLSGSNDGSNWYIIHDRISLEPSFATGTSNTYTQLAKIPANNYPYLKLVVNNEHADPIHILRIAIPDEKVTGGNNKYIYRQNPSPDFVQKDSSDGNSYITVHYDQAYHIDMIHLDIAAPKFYEREVTVKAPGNDTTERCNSCNFIGRFTISAAGKNNFETNRFKTHILQLIIGNQDNPPVKISGIMAWQKLCTVVAWLEKGNRYELLAGDPQAERPYYDLEQFTDSIPSRVRSLSFGEIDTVSAQKPLPLLPVPGNGRTMWLWAVIVAAALLLSVFSWRLLKDMKRKGF